MKLLNNSTKYQLHVLMTINSKKKSWNPCENCPMYALKLFWNVCIWDASVNRIFYGQSTNLHARLQHGPDHVTNVEHVWSLTFISRVNINCVEHCAYSEVTPFFQLAGCARNRHVYHTLRQSLRLSLWMQVFAWMLFPRSISGIWSLMWCIQNRIKNTTASWHGVTRCMVTHPRNEWILRPTHQFHKDILNCPMSILFPQTRILLVRELCCTFLKTTKQWSRWSSKAEALQWDTCPEHTELLLTGCSTGSTWTPRCKSNMLIPKANSQTS